MRSKRVLQFMGRLRAVLTIGIIELRQRHVAVQKKNRDAVALQPKRQAGVSSALSLSLFSGTNLVFVGVRH